MGQTYNTNTSSFDQIVYRSSTYFGTAAYLQSKSNAQATSWEAVAASDVVNSVAKVASNYVVTTTVTNNAVSYTDVYEFQIFAKLYAQLETIYNGAQTVYYCTYTITNINGYNNMGCQLFFLEYSAGVTAPAKYTWLKGDGATWTTHSYNAKPIPSLYKLAIGDTRPGTDGMASTYGYMTMPLYCTRRYSWNGATHSDVSQFFTTSNVYVYDSLDNDDPSHKHVCFTTVVTDYDNSATARAIVSVLGYPDNLMQSTLNFTLINKNTNNNKSSYKVNLSVDYGRFIETGVANLTTTISSKIQ